MLTILLVHLLSHRTGASHGLLLDPRAPIDACDWNTQSCRSTYGIVRGCLATIFACTWVSVHPNVPPPDPKKPDSFWAKLKWRIIVSAMLLWRRLKLMLIAVLAPELMVGFAARQFMVAWSFSTGLLGPFTAGSIWMIINGTEFKISWTHGYFISMGGFVTGGRGAHPIVTKEQIREHIADISKVPEKTIEDKSKGDGLSKGLALLQGLWFVTQCLARVVQRLPVTELEVATLAFAVLNVFIWVLWWGKPLDVLDPIVIGSDDLPEFQPQVLGWWQRCGGLLGTYDDYEPLLSDSVPSFWCISDADDVDDKYTGIPLLTEMTVGSVFGAIHCAAWNASFPTFDEMWMWRSCAVLVTVIPPLIVVLLGMGGYFESDPVIVLMMLSIPVYIVARLFLIVLPFTALRALPPGAFVDVNWSVYIPHL